MTDPIPSQETFDRRIKAYFSRKAQAVLIALTLGLLGTAGAALAWTWSTAQKAAAFQTAVADAARVAAEAKSAAEANKVDPTHITTVNERLAALVAPRGPLANISQQLDRIEGEVRSLRERVRALETRP